MGQKKNASFWVGLAENDYFVKQGLFVLARYVFFQFFNTPKP